MKLLVYGGGVTGSVCAVRLHGAGHDVSLLARGERLTALRRHGVELAEENSTAVRQVPVRIVEHPRRVRPDGSLRPRPSPQVWRPGQPQTLPCTGPVGAVAEVVWYQPFPEVPDPLPTPPSRSRYPDRRWRLSPRRRTSSADEGGAMAVSSWIERRGTRARGFALDPGRRVARGWAVRYRKFRSSRGTRRRPRFPLPGLLLIGGPQCEAYGTPALVAYDGVLVAAWQGKPQPLPRVLLGLQRNKVEPVRGRAIGGG